MSNPDKLPLTPKDKEKAPNYALRRKIAVGSLAAISALGLWKAGELTATGVSAAYSELTESDYDDHNCVNRGETVAVNQGESAWDKAGEPLADELGIPVDKAMGILATANPQIDSLGRIQSGTSIQIPDCEP